MGDGRWAAGEKRETRDEQGTRGEKGRQNRSSCTSPPSPLSLTIKSHGAIFRPSVDALNALEFHADPAQGTRRFLCTNSATVCKRCTLPVAQVKLGSVGVRRVQGASIHCSLFLGVADSSQAESSINGRQVELRALEKPRCLLARCDSAEEHTTRLPGAYLRPMCDAACCRCHHPRNGDPNIITGGSPENPEAIQKKQPTTSA